MNLLLHQDYSDHARKAVIKFFRDGIQFCQTPRSGATQPI